MTITRNPFGLRNGDIVLIQDISPSERGLKCGCVCPSCKEPFEARLGDIRTHHFAHTGEGCDEEIAFLSGMYQFLQKYVVTHSVLLPALKVYWTCYDTPYTAENFYSRIQFIPNSINVVIPIKEKKHIFKNAEIIFRGKRPLSLIVSDDKARSVAISVKPPSTCCKTYQAKPYEDLATLQLDYSDIEFNELKTEQAQDQIEKKFSTGIWLYSPKAIIALDEINKLNEVELKHKKELLKKYKEEQEKQRKGQLEQRKRDRLYFSDNRTIKCVKCGAIKPIKDFPFYDNRDNSGICKICMRSEE